MRDQSENVEIIFWREQLYNENINMDIILLSHLVQSIVIKGKYQC